MAEATDNATTTISGKHNDCYCSAAATRNPCSKDGDEMLGDDEDGEPLEDTATAGQSRRQTQHRGLDHQRHQDAHITAVPSISHITKI
ncbi:hypothetical protein SO802_009275 [Lithocarpus litseifolius]|uniref:Uncharacterized protein n=1 Tax=Lithocarpus litseifolius TaxID=425828 RepID=A0AAW2DB07_9ROSI